MADSLYHEETLPTPEPHQGAEATTPNHRMRTPRSLSSPVRKRSRNEVMWQRNMSKTLKNSGEGYIDSKGRQRDGARIRDPCSCNRECRHRVTQEERQQVFDKFWKGLANHNRQWDFIRANSTSKPTLSLPDKPNVKRKVFRNYSLEISPQRQVKVCKAMFMSTLGIWDSWISSAYSHVNPDKGNTVSPDKRGGHRVGMVYQMSEVKTASAKEHVNSFPRVPSHYCRRRTKREYLQKGLSINRMAKLYKKWAKEKNLPQASIATPRQYRDILNANFNLGFYKPKKDRCSFCSVMRDKKNSRQIREERKAAWAVHVRNKERSRKLKEKDKTAGTKDKKTAVLSFDLQKQLQCPQSESSSFYYRRKLCVFNFTIFNKIEREGVCFLWHERIGKKGSDEICSALYVYIEELVKKGYKVFIFWSDNCAGQNKNRNLFAMCEYLAVKHGIVITHKYLEPGHTQIEVDSIHANIERASEKQDIFEFKDWVEIIVSAKTESPMYRVVTLTQKDIVSFKLIVGSFQVKSANPYSSTLSDLFQTSLRWSLGDF